MNNYIDPEAYIGKLNNQFKEAVAEYAEAVLEGRFRYNYKNELVQSAKTRMEDKAIAIFKFREEELKREMAMEDRP